MNITARTWDVDGSSRLLSFKELFRNHDGPLNFTAIAPFAASGIRDNQPGNNLEIQAPCLVVICDFDKADVASQLSNASNPHTLASAQGQEINFHQVPDFKSKW